MSIEKVNVGPFAWALLNFRDHGGDGNEADRQERPADKMVEQRTLTGFETPEDSDVQSLLLREGPAALEEVLKRADLIPITDLTDSIERSGDDIWRPGLTHGAWTRARPSEAEET